MQQIYVSPFVEGSVRYITVIAGAGYCGHSATKMKLCAILSILILLVASVSNGEGRNASLPKKVSELRQLLHGQSREEAHKTTLRFLGEPTRDVGSGFRIEQWDIGGGILTFHQAIGPTFHDSAGKSTWLIATRNEVAANVHAGFEMYSLAAHSPHKNGTGYWLGNIDLNSSGQYEFRDSGQHREYKKTFPRHFFSKHLTGEFRIVYSEGVKPNDALEDIPDNTEICRVTFASGGAFKTFSIVTSRSKRRLRFESDGQVFRMNRGWNEYWPKETKMQNKSVGLTR